VARAPEALLKGPTTRPLQQVRDRALVPIHPNARKGNSRKSTSRILHSDSAMWADNGLFSALRLIARHKIWEQ
jgi:hypothetical protein